MTDEQMDRALSREPEIVPSSGFVNAVVARVAAESSAPAPIPFPWTRALPGLAACAVFVGSLRWYAQPVPVTVPFHVPASWSANLADTWMSLRNVGEMVGAGWMALALGLAYASVRLSLRFTGGHARSCGD